MADLGMAQNAREDWRRVNTHIHQEEQKLKELQLDYSEKVAVVEALKLELRQTTNDTRDNEQKAMKLAQATISGHRKLQELHQQWQSLNTDRGLLMQQLSSEQDGLKADKARLEEARATFEEELQSQRSYMRMLQKMLGVQQPEADSACDPGGVSPAGAPECDSSHALEHGVVVDTEAYVS